MGRVKTRDRKGGKVGGRGGPDLENMDVMQDQVALDPEDDRDCNGKVTLR